MRGGGRGRGKCWVKKEVSHWRDEMHFGTSKVHFNHLCVVQTWFGRGYCISGYFFPCVLQDAVVQLIVSIAETKLSFHNEEEMMLVVGLDQAVMGCAWGVVPMCWR